MILGIDASNIRGGGGVTHLVELLRAANPEEYGFVKVIIWGGTSTLEKIEERGWLKNVNEPLLNKSLIHRIYWQKFILSKLAIKENCDILFIPGGSYFGKFRPFVTMSQNLLPFELKEIKRYGFSLFSLKMVMLNYTQSNTFKNANGVIFLTEYARNVVIDKIKLNIKKLIVISHGINFKFFTRPRIHKSISKYSYNKPFKLLYVSFIGEYKHQWNVVRAIGILRQMNIPVHLTLIGSPDEKKAFSKLTKAIKEIDPNHKFVQYFSEVSYSEIEKKYKDADIFIFASSCETFGQILTEAMASGLPIACSNMSAMPEILGDAGVYFNPEDPKDIAKTLEILIQNENLRSELAQLAYIKSKQFSWEKCSNETFEFILNTYKMSKKE